MKKNLVRNTHRIAAVVCLAMTASSPLKAVQEVYAPEVGAGRSIITPKAAATPRVNGPSIFGVRPSNPFLYAIPATGERPMKFSVQGLPSGLSVDPDNGHITGRIASTEKKTYKVTLQAKNSKGSDEKAFRIVVGEKIALTPPLGWNSWNCWHQDVSQAKVLESAKAMQDAGLQRVGWMYINMDDGWQAKRGGKYNAVMPNAKFPDMKGMVDEIHAMGFKAGIYHTPWVGSYAGYCGGSSNQKDGHDWPTDSVDGVGDKARYNYFHIGEHKFDKEDTLQWADWGIDYLKDDWVLARDITPAAVARREKALRECGRDIVYSLSNTGPLKFADTFVNDSNAWRISADIRGDWDTRGTGAGSILAIMNLMQAWAPYCGPGHYPDADMMVVDGVHGGKPAKLTGDEQYSHVSLWSLWSSPMLLGSAVDKMGEFGLSILSNPEVLEIHQDALCQMATIQNSDPFGQVWVKPLENGDTAVGLLNLADEPRVITVDWSKIGVTGKRMVRDLWRQRNIQIFDDTFSAMVQPHGTVLVRLSDPVHGTIAKGEDMKQLPSAPRMNPDGGTFTSEITVSLKTDPGATIHYTLDGSPPNTQSPAYTAPFKVASFTDVKAVAIKNGVESGVSSSQFYIAPKRIPEPNVDATTLEKTRSYAEWRDVNINKTGRYDAPFKHQGTVYKQGLGFYGAGSISYPLDPSYERFVSMACLDDFSVEGATGRFAIEIDGKVASASPMMEQGDPAWLFDVEIPKDAKAITLMCYRDGVGPQFLFNYLNCGFISSGPAQTKTISPSAEKPPFPEVSLSDLNVLNVKNGWGHWRKNQNINGQPLQIGDTVYQTGLGMHANAEISYALKPEWKRFVATVGVHAGVGDKGSVQFIVEVDGNLLGCSPVMTGQSPAHHFNIALPKGVQQIRLISKDGGDGNTYDHANWVNCGFSTSDRMQSTYSPNIIYILADDLGYGELGCYGQEKIETPHIDQLRSEGMKFTQHYSGSAVCAPSRCVLLTGKHAGQAYIRGNDEWESRGPVWNYDKVNQNPELEGQRPLPAGTQTIATLLKTAGYTTACIGKWGLGAPGTEGVANKQGFDFFFGYNCQRQAHTYFPRHLWKNETKIPLRNQSVAPSTRLPEGADPLNAASYANYTLTDYAPDLMFSEITNFVDANKAKPFFLYWATPIPHVPLQAPKRWVDHYVKQFGDEHPHLAGYFPCRYPRATYAAMVSYLDENVGKLVRQLKELGIYDNTLIVFTSDNGPTFNGGSQSAWFNSAGPFNEGRPWGKCTLQEGGVRVPFIASWPGKIQAGSESDHISAFWDALPTFCEIAGVTPPEAIDGISYLPALLQQGDQKDHEFLYWEYDGTQAVRMGKWKAIRSFQKNNPQMKLFNLEEDIREETSIASAHPEIVSKIETIMQAARTPPKLNKFKLKALGD